MARFVELKNELFGDDYDQSQWIDAEKVDSFSIDPLDRPFRGAYVVQFRSGGRWIGSAFLYGENRAKAYALEVVRGGDRIA